MAIPPRHAIAGISFVRMRTLEHLSPTTLSILWIGFLYGFIHRINLPRNNRGRPLRTPPIHNTYSAACDGWIRDTLLNMLIISPDVITRGFSPGASGLAPP